MSYIHHIHIFPVKESYYNETIGDHIVTKFSYQLITVDTNTSNFTSTDILTLELPNPDINNFIPSNQITRNTYLDWINTNVDVVAIQNNNVSKL